MLKSPLEQSLPHPSFSTIPAVTPLCCPLPSMRKHLGLLTDFEVVKKRREKKRQEKATGITAKPLLQMRSVGNGNTESILTHEL